MENGSSKVLFSIRKNQTFQNAETRKNSRRLNLPRLIVAIEKELLC